MTTTPAAADHTRPHTENVAGNSVTPRTTSAASSAPITTDPNPIAIAAAAESVARHSTSSRRSTTITKPKASTFNDEDKKKVHDVASRVAFDKLLGDAANKIVMVQFYAQWCGACKLIGHRLKDLAELYMDKAVIARIDVDECEEIAGEFNVTSIPTFVYMKNKQKLTIIVGSNQAKMEETLEKYVTGIGVLVGVPDPAAAGGPRPSRT